MGEKMLDWVGTWAVMEMNRRAAEEALHEMERYFDEDCGRKRRSRKKRRRSSRKRGRR